MMAARGRTPGPSSFQLPLNSFSSIPFSCRPLSIDRVGAASLFPPHGGFTVNSADLGFAVQKKSLLVKLFD